MYVTLDKKVTEAIGPTELTPFGYSEDSHRWSKDLSVNLSSLTRAKAEKLKKLLDRFTTLRGVSTQVRVIESWLAILDGDKVRCRHIKHFAPMLKQYLKDAPKHWVYQLREHSDVWQPYYVSGIEYHPPQKRDGYTSPAYVTVSLHYEELGEVQHSLLTFHAEDCEDMTVGQALAASGWMTEDADRLATYQANKERYIGIHDKVGMQFTAVGTAESESTDRESYWWRSAMTTIRLDRNGEPARVVVDVLHEKDKENTRRQQVPSGSFWEKEACDYTGKEEDDDRDIRPGDEDADEDHVRHTPEVPLKPALMVFDLKRHARLRVHVDQMAEYTYDTSLSEKLILPDDVRSLVDLLVAHKGGFRDIVGGKGSGAIVLCAGRPGTGKTLTAEVYSEAMERPLYSVQCSQLGLDAEDLETELLKVFARAIRWNAILLLDEADVYVASRGSDLKQNAIVGVFLRVLEYYAGVLFLTTNRADLVDDAIASRCLARIDYKVPTPENQKRIWRTLSDTAGIPIPKREVDRIVARHPGLSGRDVKNLLKLAHMVASARGEEVTAEVVDYIKQFKPTTDSEG